MGRNAVRAQLRHQIDAVGDRVVTAVAREIPAYAEMGEAQSRETRAIARWAIDRLVDLWVDDLELTPHDLQRFRGIGVSRANDGRPLLVVLRAYRVAAVEISATLVCFGDDLGIEDVVALNRVLLTSVDQLSEALFSGYTSGSERLTSDREATLQRLFDDMVAGRQTSAAALRDRAAQLGIAVPERVSLLLVRPAAVGEGEAVADDELSALGGAVTSTAARSGGGRDEPMVLRRRSGGVGALLAPSFVGRDDLTRELERRSWVGCVVDGFAVAELPAVHRLASVAVERAPGEAFEGRVLLDRGDALVVALLHRQPVVVPGAVAEEVLGELLRPGNEHLLDGLTAFLRTGAATEAAQALGVHPQTMRYRLRRAATLTGRDPRRAWDRLVLDIGRSERTVGAAR